MDATLGVGIYPPRSAQRGPREETVRDSEFPLHSRDLLRAGWSIRPRVVRGKYWAKACAVLVLLASGTVGSHAQTFATLHSFDYTDGSGPVGALVQAINGDLNGTVQGGGDGFGTVFKMTTTGDLLQSLKLTYGWEPEAGLVAGTNGDLYGTTYSGGTNGSGTVFRLTEGGTLTTLYSFCSEPGCADGAAPSAALVLASDGNFYGTTQAFGLGPFGNGGTVFRITATGELTTLYGFCSQSGCADGQWPIGGLVEGRDGDFYGTTVYGGANGSGTVFKIAPNGTLITLYSFCSESGCADGGNPEGTLVQAPSGSLYGTAPAGGTGFGTIFNITTDGVLTTIHAFCSESKCTDGSNPGRGLVQATDGNFYGTATNGGTHGDGTIFEMSPSGIFETLHNFDSTKGARPMAGLIQDTDGRFYGTTLQGGESNACVGGCGTAFSLSIGLGPFVKTLPAAGKTGASVKILGTNLTGTTSVTFAGTVAAFTIISPSLITTTVPAGAATGVVQVVTPGGTLESNVPFRVVQ